jgi:hypothetical protein
MSDARWLRSLRGRLAPVGRRATLALMGPGAGAFRGRKDPPTFRGAGTRMQMSEQSAAAGHAIELRVEDVSQLFHTLDPFPFRERDLDNEAEEFIVSWARELPRDRPLRIVVHLPATQASLPEAHEIGAAISRYFGYRAHIIGLDLKELFRVGRRALAIGVAVLSFSVIVGHTVVARLAPQPVAGVIAESLLIFGWVANWRPIEIFLYEWWPLVRRRDLYRRLAAAQVKLKPYKSGRGGRIPSED